MPRDGEAGAKPAVAEPLEPQLGRAGRRAAGRPGRAGRWKRVPEPAAEPAASAPEILAAAGFIALLRTLDKSEAARTELCAGRVRQFPRLRSVQAEALLGLSRRLEAAVEAWAAQEQDATGAVHRPEVVVRPLVRVGPDDLVRPELALLVVRGHEGSGAGDRPTPPTYVAGALGTASVGPAQVALAVELAPPSGGRANEADRMSARLMAYARAGIREVWLLDLERGWTEAYRTPWAGAFTSRTLWYPGEEVPLAALGGAGVLALEFG